MFPHMSSDALKRFQARVENLKERLAMPFLPSAIIAADCLSILKHAFGSAGLLAHLLEERRLAKGELTAEEIAENERIDEEIEEMQREESARLAKEYRPVINESYWQDLRNLALGLVCAAEESEQEFDRMLKLIYRERVLKLRIKN